MPVPRPTAGGMLFLIAAAVALGSAFMNVGLITALAASLLTAFAVSGFIMSLFAAFGYEIRRESMLEGSCLGRIALPLTVRNRTFFFRQPCVIIEKLPFCRSGTLAVELPALNPFQTIRLEREIIAVRRGHFHLDRIRLVSGDPCGLFRVHRTFRLPAETAIHPAIRPLSGLPAGAGSELSLNGDGRPQGRAGLGSEFFGVRPYRPGDEIRYVHWGLSASKRQLMVREFEAAAIDRIIVILDTEKKSVGLDPAESNFEALVSLAASISDYFATQYCYLTFLTILDGNLMMINGDAAGVRVKVMELLTEIRPGEIPLEHLMADVLENLPQNSMLYLLTMSAREPVKGMLRLLEDQDIRLHWICAAREHFPVITDTEPVEMLLPAEEERFPHVFGPRLMTCLTPWEELFRHEAEEA
ncbi:MAG: DUF58 domain-containing protein [Lentisphaeria bacterium]|nr:DUF58 domain-containing protein [Lentisphaeria bacterium]